jgi:periplasmic protein CpxP/Spy
MHRAYLPKALALTLLTAGLGIAGAQQTQSAPDTNAPQQTAPYHHRHAPNPQKQAEHLGKKLNLTPDQTAKIEPILAARDQQMQTLWQNRQLAPQDRHQQMRSINKTAEEQMATVLSPDQMAQLKAMRHAHHHGQHGENGDGAQQPS